MEVGHKNFTTIGTKCRVAKRVGHHLYDMKVLNVLWSPGSPATDWSHLAVPGTADTGQSGATTPPPLFRTLTNKISIVKLREREGHRVDPGRSLKGAKVFKGR